MLSVPAGNSAEVALVGGEDVEAPVPLGQYDARGVGKVEGRQVSVAGEQGTRPCQIVARESLHLVSLFDLFEGRELPPASEAVEDEVVQLRQDDRGDDEGSAGSLYGFEEQVVVVLVAVEDRQKPAGVNDERQRSER